MHVICDSLPQEPINKLKLHIMTEKMRKSWQWTIIQAHKLSSGQIDCQTSEKLFVLLLQ